MRYITFLLAVLTIPAAAADGTVYKSVDKAGNVTYSATPPGEAVRSETIELPPGPSPEEVREAEERKKQIEQTGTRLEKERKAREAQMQAPPPAEGETPATVTTPVIPAIRSRMSPGTTTPGTSVPGTTTP